MFCLFIGRSIISCSTQSLSLYSLEYYPTSIRAIGLGSCSAISRLGAMSTAFVAQLLFKMAPHVSLNFYAFFSLVAAALSLTLTIETKGRILYVIKNYFLILKIENVHFLSNILGWWKRSWQSKIMPIIEIILPKADFFLTLQEKVLND